MAVACPDSGDVAVAEAAIGILTAPITTDRLADALDWPLARLMAALPGLDTALEHAGSRVATDGLYLLGLHPRHRLLTEAQHEAAAQRLRGRHLALRSRSARPLPPRRTRPPTH
jgi:hypothetical protein